MVTPTRPAASVTESAGQIWAELARRYGPSLVLLEHHPAPEAGKARRPSTWSASAPAAARTGWACGRPQRRIPVTPGSNCGWRSTVTGSSASQRAGPARARTDRLKLGHLLATPWVQVEPHSGSHRVISCVTDGQSPFSSGEQPREREARHGGGHPGHPGDSGARLHAPGRA